MVPNEAWLGESFLLSEPSARALKVTGGLVTRGVVLDDLAEQLGFDTRVLGEASQDLLWGLLEGLESFAHPKRDTLTFEQEATRHQTIAQRAVAAVKTPGDLIAVFHQVRWQNHQIGRNVAVNQIEQELRRLLERLLAEKVRRMLQRWQRDHGFGAESWGSEPWAKGDLEP
jgi:hypothetical protein